MVNGLWYLTLIDSVKIHWSGYDDLLEKETFFIILKSVFYLSIKKLKDKSEIKIKENKVFYKYTSFFKNVEKDLIIKWEIEGNDIFERNVFIRFREL